MPSNFRPTRTGRDSRSKSSDNNMFTLTLSSVTGNTSAARLPAEAQTAPLPLYQRQPDNIYWYEYLPDTRTLYVQYNACRDDPALPFDQFARELLAFVDARAVGRFVVDLRANDGGNSAIAQPSPPPLLRPTTSRTPIRRWREFWRITNHSRSTQCRHRMRQSGVSPWRDTALSCFR
jgi:hypothetical protein